MATEIRGLSVGSLSCVTDLSGQQFRFAKLSAARTLAVCAAATDKPLGVIQNKPVGTAGSPQPVDLMVTGVTKLVAGAAVAAGDDLTADATGRAITAVAAGGANRSYGVALEAAAGAGVVFEALLPGVAKAL